MRRALTTAATCGALLVVAIGCGSEHRTAERPSTARETADEPAAPPAGWRTVSDTTAGFTISVPRDWSTTRRKGSTLIRSQDNAIAVTVVADRSESGRQAAAPDYARRVISELPGFDGTVQPGAGRVAGSPYSTAVVQATGTIRGGGRRQRVTVAVFNRPQLVSYGVVVLADVRTGRARSHGLIARILASLRARPPARRTASGRAASAQRSGRSG